MKRAALLVLLGLIAGACRIEVDLRVDLQPDGSGNIDLAITTDEEFERLYRLTGNELEEFIVLRGENIGLTFDVTEGADKVYHSGAQELSAEAIDSALEGLVPNLGTVEITASEETLEFTGDFKPLPEADLLLPFFTNFDPAELAENADIEVTLTVPGDLEVSTATLVEDTHLTFELPFEDQPIRIFARSRLVPKDSGSFPWVLAIVLIVVAAALAFLVAVRRQGGQVVESALPQPYVPYAPEDQPVAPPPPKQQEPAPPPRKPEQEPEPAKASDVEQPSPADQVMAILEEQDET